MSRVLDTASPPGVERPVLVAALAGVALAAVMCAASHYAMAAATAACAIALGFTISGRLPATTLLIAWFALTPIASFFVRVPLEKSLLTFDRIVFACLPLALIFNFLKRRRTVETNAPLPPGPPAPLQRKVSRFEIAWAMLAALAAASVLMKSADIGYSFKIAIDSFWLPLIAFHVARYHFDIKNRGRLFLLATIALALFLFAAGAYEFITGNNLFQYKGSELIREGERRVNGPFASDSSYAIICLLLAVFLRFAPRFLRVRLDAGARLVYGGALVAAVAGALLSTFRAVALAILVCWVILEAAGRKDWQRVTVNAVAVAVMVLTLLGGLALLAPRSSLAERLTNPRNAVGRLVTWSAAVEIAAANPVFGVGLMNYRDYFTQAYSGRGRSFLETTFDTNIANTPHSNLLWIAAELGVGAFALYVIANVCLLLMGYRAWRRAYDGRGRTAAGCYLALLAAYWIPGLTLASGVYSDLNLYFFFLLGLLLNIACSGERYE
ncbi:MAG TPA: O-antigen ligase family protein [Blastocatellia bacterium]|nr:O-antigen ligase family protein [Blastocatellia bacterium]